MAHKSHTMPTCGLTDMYTLSPWALGVHIRQTTRVHGVTITYIQYSSKGTSHSLALFFRVARCT